MPHSQGLSNNSYSEQNQPNSEVDFCRQTAEKPRMEKSLNQKLIEITVVTTSVIETIKRSRRFFGHLKRTNNDSITKMKLEWNAEVGRRRRIRRGEPRNNG